MKSPDQDNLKALFERFMPPSEAQTAADEIHEADKLLQAYPAPQPRPEVLAGIKLRLGVQLAAHHRVSSPFFRFFGAAAAVILVVLIGLLGQNPPSRPNPTHIAHAALIPTAIWESDDLSTDDLDIAYYSSEIRQIEAQVHALETGESETVVASTLDDVEMELLRINCDFWKE